MRPQLPEACLGLPALVQCHERAARRAARPQRATARPVASPSR